LARDAAEKAADLPALTGLLDQALLADLPEAVNHLMGRIQSEAAVASDVGQLMGALPPLVQVQRYGNVRQTDAGMIAGWSMDWSRASASDCRWPVPRSMTKRLE